MTYFEDEIFKLILYENCCILIQMLLKYVPNGPDNNDVAMVLKRDSHKSHILNQ